ncbi:tRNA 2-thiouridine(34) synthase MnmA [Patescibacteria group bacterium]
MKKKVERSTRATQKVAIALSGGVDSGVAAGLLVKDGYQVAGFHLHLWSEKNITPGVDEHSFTNKCCNPESEEAARATAHQLGIPFYVVHFEKEFKKAVVDYFLKEYGLGRTPNPCVMCNRLIKFGGLLDYVQKLGYDYLATGHYARTVLSGTKGRSFLREKNLSHISYHLLQAKDELKDQSYFLYSLTQKQLAHLMFPVGEMTKKKVYTLAKKWRLPVAKRPESQEVCFYPESNYRPFLKRHIKDKIISGKVVDTKGNVIGRHNGLPLYTIGQRHGFDIKSKIIKSKHPGGGAKAKDFLPRGGIQPSVIPPFYVISKDIRKNQLVVGFGRETEKKEFVVNQLNWINPNILISQYPDIFIRIRHQGELLKCKMQVTPRKTRRGGVARRIGGTPPRWMEGKVKVTLDHPQRGIAPGQTAVFYRKSKIKSQKFEFKAPPGRAKAFPGGGNQVDEAFQLLGGGIIEE